MATSNPHLPRQGSYWAMCDDSSSFRFCKRSPSATHMPLECCQVLLQFGQILPERFWPNFGNFQPLTKVAQHCSISGVHWPQISKKGCQCVCRKIWQSVATATDGPVCTASTLTWSNFGPHTDQTSARFGPTRLSFGKAGRGSRPSCRMCCPMWSKSGHIDQTRPKTRADRSQAKVERELHMNGM